MISRRRFLTISAAAAAAPAAARAPVRWHGQALGAQASLTIDAPAPLAARAISIVERTLAHAEAQFSLYRPDSALRQLNRTGVLTAPHPDFLSLMDLSDRVHHATGGAFDPTVQTLWQALSERRGTSRAIALIGWNRVRITPDRVELAPGQALTLNGIAQGFVTDQIAHRLRAIGLRNVLVNIGEFSAIGGPWTLGIADPEHGLQERVQLTDRAIATSSGMATMVGGQSHILDPSGARSPRWSTVSVIADSAALADAASTAFMLMSLPDILIARVRLHPTMRLHLMDSQGQTQRI
ncbi:FAD:protein FMN transferase [Thalassobius sp. S69A]|uniref:FAD:protein FMN transferase n=1 Tax=unclassified Thalassovita TaxID=2619711 RepID=UPI000C4C1FAB|nr:nosX [Paracoccaceae bacterium]